MGKGVNPLGRSNSLEVIDTRLTGLESRIRTLEGLLGLRRKELSVREWEKAVARIEELGEKLTQGLRPDRIPIADALWWVETVAPHLDAAGLERLGLRERPERHRTIEQIFKVLDARVLHTIKNAAHPRFDLLLIGLRDGLALYRSSKESLRLRTEGAAPPKQPDITSEPLRRAIFARRPRPSLPALPYTSRT